MRCSKCNYNACRCSIVKQETNIVSDQAGRPGLNNYEIAKLVGKYNGSIEDFPEWSRGDKGDKGDEGDTYIPDLTDNFFDE